MADETDLGEITQGTTLTLTGLFTNSTGDPVDPVNVTLHLEEAGNLESTFETGDLSNPTVGTWEYNYRFDVVGKYEGSFLGVSTGSDSSVAENFYGRVIERD